jgi:hypothetical protein
VPIRPVTLRPRVSGGFALFEEPASLAGGNADRRTGVPCRRAPAGMSAGSAAEARESFSRHGIKCGPVAQRARNPRASRVAKPGSATATVRFRQPVPIPYSARA